MTTSMTKGRPLKLILQFAAPLLIGNLLQQAYNIIDAAIVGRVLGTEALAGVGASSSVQFLVLGFCTGTQAVSGLLCLCFIVKHVEVLRLSRKNCRMQKDVTKELALMGFPMRLQFSITAIGSMVMQSANNGLGSVFVSGFTAGMRIKQFTMCPFDAIGTAISVYCGQNLGAGKPDRIRKGIYEGLVVAVVYGLAAGMILNFFGRTLSMLFVSKEAADVLDASGKYLRYLGFVYWALGILNVCRLSTQGLGYSGRSVFSGVTEMFARSIVGIVYVQYFGFTAICAADPAAWVSACFYIIPTCLFCVKRASERLKG